MSEQAGTFLASQNPLAFSAFGKSVYRSNQDFYTKLAFIGGFRNGIDPKTSGIWKLIALYRATAILDHPRRRSIEQLLIVNKFLKNDYIE